MADPDGRQPVLAGAHHQRRLTAHPVSVPSPDVEVTLEPPQVLLNQSPELINASLRVAQHPVGRLGRERVVRLAHHVDQIVHEPLGAVADETKTQILDLGHDRDLVGMGRRLPSQALRALMELGGE